jgi:hypothetical protein
MCVTRPPSYAVKVITTFQLFDRIRMDPLLSPIRIFPADAQIVVISGFYFVTLWKWGGGGYLEYFRFFDIVLVLGQRLCIEEAEMSPLVIRLNGMEEGNTFARDIYGLVVLLMRILALAVDLLKEKKQLIVFSQDI